MGNLQSALRKRFGDLFSLFQQKKASLAILGLDSSGKSTLVNLFRDSNIPTVPTLGFNVEEIELLNTVVKIWDVGGQKEFMNYWSEYVKDIDGLVFMVDLMDDKRFEASFKSFKNLASYLRDGLPVLLLLNKTDLVEAHEGIEGVEKRIETVKGIYCADTRCGSESFMSVDGKRFKSRVHGISVKNDLEKMSSAGNSWNIRDASVFPGFKWLMDSIEVKGGRQGI